MVCPSPILSIKLHDRRYDCDRIIRRFGDEVRIAQLGVETFWMQGERILRCQNRAGHGFLPTYKESAMFGDCMITLYRRAFLVCIISLSLLFTSDTLFAWLYANSTPGYGSLHDCTLLVCFVVSFITIYSVMSLGSFTSTIDDGGILCLISC